MHTRVCIIMYQSQINCKDIIEILQNRKDTVFVALIKIKRSVRKIPDSLIGKLLQNFATKFSKEPICTEHALSQCCGNEAVFNLLSLSPANHCYAKY